MSRYDIQLIKNDFFYQPYGCKKNLLFPERKNATQMSHLAGLSKEVDLIVALRIS